MMGGVVSPTHKWWFAFPDAVDDNRYSICYRNNKNKSCGNNFFGDKSSAKVIGGVEEADNPGSGKDYSKKLWTGISHE